MRSVRRGVYVRISCTGRALRISEGYLTLKYPASMKPYTLKSSLVFHALAVLTYNPYLQLSFTRITDTSR